MKVLILANDYKTIANFRIELLVKLVEEDHEVLLSVPASEHNEQFREIGCTVIENNMTRHGTNPLAEFKLVSEYDKLIKDTTPDVVLTYTIKPNIYGSIAARKNKVTVMNTVTGIGSTLQGKGFKQTLMFMLLSLGMKKSDVVFFQNKGNLDLFSEHGIKGNETVLLPGSGVNLSKFTFVPYPEENGKVKFIIVSRLRGDKGFSELFDAVRALGKRDDLEFHIVGWCEEEQYQAQALEIQREYPVIIHGEKTQSETRELISQSHSIIHPSYHEGMANVLMEAAATGRACLASDIPGCREIINDGETGYTFEVKSADAIVKAVNDFMSLTAQERAQMGVNARKKIENEFDRNIVVNTYIKTIEKHCES